MVLFPFTWSGSGGETLMTEERVSSAALGGSPPVEPGGFPVVRILRQIQLGIKGLVEIKNEVLRAGQGAAKKDPGGKEYGPGSGESGLSHRPKREAVQKATEAMKKGADATRGRGPRRGWLYQGAGTRN